MYSNDRIGLVGFGVVLTMLLIVGCDCKNRKENSYDCQQTTSSQLMGTRDEDNQSVRTFFDPQENYQLTTKLPKLSDDDIQKLFATRILQDPQENCAFVKLLNYLCGSLLKERNNAETATTDSQNCSTLLQLLKYLSYNSPSLRHESPAVDSYDPQTNSELIKSSNVLCNSLSEKEPIATALLDNTGYANILKYLRDTLSDLTKISPETSSSDSEKLRQLTEMLNNEYSKLFQIERTNDGTARPCPNLQNNDELLELLKCISDCSAVRNLSKESALMSHPNDGENSQLMELLKYLFVEGVINHPETVVLDLVENYEMINLDPELNCEFSELKRYTSDSNITTNILESLTLYPQDQCKVIDLPIEPCNQGSPTRSILNPHHSVLLDLVKSKRRQLNKCVPDTKPCCELTVGKLCDPQLHSKIDSSKYLPAGCTESLLSDPQLRTDFLNLLRYLSVEDLTKTQKLSEIKKYNQLLNLLKCLYMSSERAKIYPERSIIDPHLRCDIFNLTKYIYDTKSPKKCAFEPQRNSEIILPADQYVEEYTETTLLDPQVYTELIELSKYFNNEDQSKECVVQCLSDHTELLELSKYFNDEDQNKDSVKQCLSDPTEMSALFKYSPEDEFSKEYCTLLSVEPQKVIEVIKLPTSVEKHTGIAEGTSFDPYTYSKLMDILTVVSNEICTNDSLTPSLSDPEINSMLMETSNYLFGLIEDSNPQENVQLMELIKCLSAEKRAERSGSLSSADLQKHCELIELLKSLVFQCTKETPEGLVLDPAVESELAKLFSCKLVNEYVRDPQVPFGIMTLPYIPVNTSAGDLTEASVSFSSTDGEIHRLMQSSEYGSVSSIIQNVDVSIPEIFQLTTTDDSQRSQMEIAKINDLLNTYEDYDLFKYYEVFNSDLEIYVGHLLKMISAEGGAPSFGLGQKPYHCGMPVVPWCHSMTPSYPSSGIPPSYYVQSVTIGKSDSKSDDKQPECSKKKLKCRKEASESESEEEYDYEYEDPCHTQRNKNSCSQRKKSGQSRSEGTCDKHQQYRSETEYDPGQQYRSESNFNENQQYRSNGNADSQQYKSASNYNPVEQSCNYDPAVQSGNFDHNTRDNYESAAQSRSSGNYESRSADAYYDQDVQKSNSKDSRCRKQDQFDNFEWDPVNHEEDEYYEDTEDYYDPPPKCRKCKRKCKSKCKDCKDKCDAKTCKKRKSSS